jgi:hypothetical protein
VTRRKVSSPAALRLARIRWAMTLVFAATTTVCLVVLAVIAANIDSTSRQHDLDADLAPRIGSLSQTVYVSGGSLHLAKLSSDSVARTSQAFGVIASGQIQIASPSQAALPSDTDLARIIAAVGDHSSGVDVTAQSEQGNGFVWAAARIPNGRSLGAIVLVGASTAQSDAAHDQLLLGLMATVIVLVLWQRPPDTCCRAARCDRHYAVSTSRSSFSSRRHTNYGLRLRL